MLRRLLKMKQIITFCVLAVAAAAPASKLYTHIDTKLLSYDNENKGTIDEIIPQPQIKYHYKNGPSYNRKTGGQGDLELINEILKLYSMLGFDGFKSYSWVGPDGVKYTLDYIIDGSAGVQPSTPPPDKFIGSTFSAPISGPCLASLVGCG